MVVLRTFDLDKRYESGVLALDRVSLAVGESESVGVAVTSAVGWCVGDGEELGSGVEDGAAVRVGVGPAST